MNEFTFSDSDVTTHRSTVTKEGEFLVVRNVYGHIVLAVREGDLRLEMLMEDINTVPVFRWVNYARDYVTENPL